MSAEADTVNYSRIVKRSARAVQLDLGEKKPVWFPLRLVALDEAAYTVTGPQDLMAEKIAEAQGAAVKHDPRREDRVPLPDPAQETAKAVRIDVIVSGLGGRGKVKKELWFPKSMLDADGAAPYWLVDKKQKEAVRAVAKARNCDESRLIVRPFTEKGLLAAASATAEAPPAEPQALRRAAQQAFACQSP